MTHPAVRKLQKRLGLSEHTNYFGRHTRAHVKRVQAAAQIPVTGVVDRRTWRKVRLVRPALAKAAATSPVLGTHPAIGQIAAPLTRFRDGGHAYYLYGRGLRSCQYTGRCMDLFAAIGEPVYALANGVLTTPGYAANSFGKHAMVIHGDGSKSLYAHLNSITAGPGRITAGTQIGTVGCSGTSGEPNACRNSPAHLHFEWSGLRWKPGQYGELPPSFNQWRGTPKRCFKGC